MQTLEVQGASPCECSSYHPRTRDLGGGTGLIIPCEVGRGHHQVFKCRGQGPKLNPRGDVIQRKPKGNLGEGLLKIIPGEAESNHLLLHSPDALPGWSWARLKHVTWVAGTW